MPFHGSARLIVGTRGTRGVLISVILIIPMLPDLI